MEISILGVGNMGGAICKKLLDQNNCQLSLVDPNIYNFLKSISKSNYIKTPKAYKNLAHYAKTLNKKKAILILAIKPNQLFNLNEEIKPEKDISFKNFIIVSVVAGVSISTIRKIFKTDNIVRAMPNTPVNIGQGMTGIYFPKKISKKDKQNVINIFELLGKTLIVNAEKKLHSVTALSGSGPAYFFNFLEALLSTGKELGLSEKETLILVKQTAIGAVSLFNEAVEPVSSLRENVTSKGGTTEIALKTLRKNNFEDLILKAVIAAKKKSVTMGLELNSKIK